MFLPVEMFNAFRVEMEKQFTDIVMFNNYNDIVLYYGAEKYKITTEKDRTEISNGNWYLDICHLCINDLVEQSTKMIKKSSSYDKLKILYKKLESIEKRMDTFEEMLGYAPDLYVVKGNESFQEKVQKQNNL